MKNRAFITVILFILEIILSSCAAGLQTDAFPGDVSIIASGRTNIYRLKTDRQSIPLFDTSGADASTCLLVLEDAYRSIRFIEKTT